jgi:hypothetical protein
MHCSKISRLHCRQTLPRLSGAPERTRGRSRLQAPHGPHADVRLRGDARGRHDSIRQELAAGVRRLDC